MATGEIFNHSFKSGKKHKQANEESKDSEFTKKPNTKIEFNKKVLALVALGAGAMTTIGGFVGWELGNEKAQAEAEALTTPKTQTESTQISNDEQVENAKTLEDEYYDTYSNWTITDYKDSVNSLEVSSINNLTEKEVLNSEEVSQEDIDMLGSFYMDKTINSAVLYSYIKDPNVYALISYKEYQKKALDKSDPEARGQAILSLEFWSRIASYTTQGKEARTIQRFMNLIEPTSDGGIITSGVCSDTLIMISDLEKQGAQEGRKITINNPKPEQIPKFISFEEQLPNLTDSMGNTYHDAEIIKYQVDNQEFYKLTAWPDYKRVDYKGDNIELPMTIIYGNTVEEVKASAEKLVSY